MAVVLYNLGFALVPFYGSHNTCVATTADDGKQDDATQKVPHCNVDADQKMAYCNIDAGQKMPHNNSDATQKILHYNVDTGQKVAHCNVDAGQKKAQNLDRIAILKVKEQSNQCFPSQ